MHPFSLVKEDTQEVTGGRSDDFVMYPFDPVFPPDLEPSTMMYGEEGGDLPIWPIDRDFK